MSHLQFAITGQTITRLDKFRPAAKSKNYLTASFTFPAEWSGTKTAIFKDGDKYIKTILDEYGECTVPWEWLQEPGTKYVSVYCGSLITANSAIVEVYHTGYNEQAEEGQAPSPTVYEQLIDHFDSKTEEVEQYTIRAEEAAQIAGEEEERVVQLANQVYTAAEQVRGDATQVHDDAFNAHADRVQAEIAATGASSSATTARLEKESAIKAKEAAAEAKTAAQQAVGNANQSAENAARSAENAARSAENARQNAEQSRQDYTALEGEIHSSVSELKADLSASSKRIDNLDSRVTVLENEPKVPQSLIDQVGANTEKNTEQDQRLEDLKHTDEELSNRIKVLEDEPKIPKDLEDRVSKLEYSISSAQRIIEDHIRATPDYGTYTVKFPTWETSHTSTGEKLDDNVGLVLTPATDTVKEINTYPHCFDTIDVNAYVDENGVRHITAIKGDPDFRDTGRVDVFVCLRTYWEKYWVEDGYEYYSRCYYPKEGYTVVSLAKNRDGSINPWFLIAKYMAGDILDDDSVHTHELYSSKGLRPAHYIGLPTGDEEISDSISWSGMQSIFKRRGAFYTGSLIGEQKHFVTTMWLYFATKNSQSIMYGHSNSSFQYLCAEPTENQNGFVVTASQAASIDLLQCVSIGDNGLTTAPDRNSGVCHNIAYDVRVISKETLESGNVAIIVDHVPFTTTATSWISSFHEVSGYSNLILGRNGSPVSNTNGRHGMVLDGIELMVGGYETLGNIIFNATSDPTVRDFVMTNDATKLSTNVNTFIANGTVLDLKPRVTTTGTWNYVTKVDLDLENGAVVNTGAGETGHGSAYGYADGQYFDAITTGQREVLSLGALWTGSSAGLRCVNGNYGVSIAIWYILARLSINAVGG